jgi:predicted dehydrogenase
VEAPEYHDLDQALQAERPDVVLVTNPTSLHVSAARRAIEAGAHVLVEKPLGSSTDGVAELVAAARERGRCLMVAYNLRFHPGLVRTKALLDQHVIGRVVSARAEASEYLPDWHPWEDYRAGYSARRDLGGGAVLTFSHELDALCWLLGAPRQVAAMTAQSSSLDLDVEDLAEMLLTFDGGALASVHLDYVRRAPRRTIELVGEQGVLRWDYHRNQVALYTLDTRQWRLEDGQPTYTRNQMYMDELRYFVDAVRGGAAKQPDLDGRQGAAVLGLALATLRSAAEGRTIDLHAEDRTTRECLSSFNRRA